MALTDVARFHKDVKVILNKVEQLVHENKELDSQVESLNIKKKKNATKVCVLLAEAHKLKIESYQVIEVEDSASQVEQSRGVIQELFVDVEQPIDLIGIQLRETNKNVREKEKVYSSVADLNEEERVLLGKIHESTRNLKDHENLLQTMERKNGRDENWKNMFETVERFSVVHNNYKTSKERRISVIQSELKHRRKIIRRDKFLINQEASSGRVAAAGPSVPKSGFSTKRRLNESVLDCGKIIKKIPSTEIEAMAPKKLKAEEESPDSAHQCNFEYCQRSFTAASPMVSHLENHYDQNQAKIDCPFPSCQFANSREILTRHIRSKHTKEQMFTCVFCPAKFHTMAAKVGHEKKHNQLEVSQCDNQDCLKFYKVAMGGCRKCSKK